MDSRPVLHETLCARWQTSRQNLDRVDSEARFGITVPSVEVGRRVIIIIHRDHDAEESADLGHGASVLADERPFLRHDFSAPAPFSRAKSQTPSPPRPSVGRAQHILLPGQALIVRGDRPLAIAIGEESKRRSRGDDGETRKHYGRVDDIYLAITRAGAGRVALDENALREEDAGPGQAQQPSRTRLALVHPRVVPGGIAAHVRLSGIGERGSPIVTTAAGDPRSRRSSLSSSAHRAAVALFAAAQASPSHVPTPLCAPAVPATRAQRMIPRIAFMNHRRSEAL